MPSKRAHHTPMAGSGAQRIVLTGDSPLLSSACAPAQTRAGSPLLAPGSTAGCHHTMPHAPIAPCTHPGPPLHPVSAYTEPI